jgi:hypothetical protein
MDEPGSASAREGYDVGVGWEEVARYIRSHGQLDLLPMLSWLTKMCLTGG